MADRPDRSPPAGSGPRLTPAAFASRFQEVWERLWYVAAAVLGNRSGADDVLQEAAIVALEKLTQFEPETNFAAWMARIVRFVALNHSRRRHGASLDAMDQPSPSSNGRSGVLSPGSPRLNGHGQLSEDQDSFDDAVAAALGELEEDARACLLLRTLLDMPYKEIALALDMPEGTAMSHVHRARAAMRRRLTAAPTHESRTDHD